MAPATTLSAATQRDRGMATNSRAAEAYSRIRQLIVTLALEPNALIDEQRLAGALGLGLTPVRQALRRLAWEGLVVILPRRGTLVADLSGTDLQKLFELRVELAPLAARLAAARASDPQRTAFRAIATRIRSLAVNEPVQLIGLDAQMHALVGAASQNEFLELTLDWLYAHVRRLWVSEPDRLVSLRAAIEDHAVIADAISERDQATAGARMRVHVEQFQSEYLKV